MTEIAGQHDSLHDSLDLVPTSALLHALSRRFEAGVFAASYPAPGRRADELMDFWGERRRAQGLGVGIVARVQTVIDASAVDVTFKEVP
jgi:hypothetical protein